MFTDDSDYVVEQYIKPTKVRKRLINDERADLLGNFDDDDNKFKKKAKKPKQLVVSEENPFADADESEDETEKNNKNGDEEDSENEAIDAGEENEEENDEEANVNSDDNEEVNDEDNDEDIEDEAEVSEEVSSESESNPPVEVQPKPKNKKAKLAEKIKHPVAKPEKKQNLTDDQVQALMRGCNKKDRFVLYVTNLNYSTTREALTDFFSVAGSVKSVRVPKVRRSAFAFVEMSDINSFKNALALHNRTLDNYTIKVQISEGGKKKSANKKNILKQKNRKLAEMRNETKQFQRSGKGYDKTIKKEINQRKIQMNRRIAKKQAKK